MLRRLFPEQFDNRYLGQKAGLWLFVPIVIAQVGISLVGIFRSDGGAQSADGIPLSSYPPDAAHAVVGVAALLGLEACCLD